MQRNAVPGTKRVGPRRVFILLAVVVGVVALHETGSHAADLYWSLDNSAKWAVGAVSITPYSGGTINFDSVESYSGYVAFVGWEHTVANESHRLMIVGISADSTIGASSVTYDGEGLTCAGTIASPENGAQVQVQIWYKLNPNVGKNWVIVMLEGTTDVVFGSVSFYGAEQSAPDFSSNTGETMFPGISVTTVNELILDVVAAPDAAGGLTCVTLPGVRSKLYSLAQSHSEEDPRVYTYGGTGLGAESTAVKTISFAASGSDDGVLLEWETATEVDTAGFNILRAEAGEGPWLTLNQDLIPSRGSSWGGATYAFSDEGREPGTVYWYCVEEVNTEGGTIRHPTELVWDEGLTDADGDGMPDVWEQRLGIDTGSEVDANADADGDGSTNLEEYLAGTSPVDARDRPRLRIERPEARNRVSLAWLGRPARTYKLVTADSLPELLGVSPRVLSVVPATSSGPMSLEDVPGAENRMRFYRLIISPPR